ncbi:hypothetical protein Goari_017793, partial [Gossypium aridum]|nr:hypothetical protein [Gossypium aridum]
KYRGLLHKTQAEPVYSLISTPTLINKESDVVPGVVDEGNFEFITSYMNRIDEVIKSKVEDVLYDVCVSEVDPILIPNLRYTHVKWNVSPPILVRAVRMMISIGSLRRGRPRKGQSKGSVTASPLKKFANESLSDSDFKNRKKATLKEAKRQRKLGIWANY